MALGVGIRALAMSFAAAAAPPAENDAPPREVGRIDLPGIGGRIDHLAVGVAARSYTRSLCEGPEIYRHLDARIPTISASSKEGVPWMSFISRSLSCSGC